MRGVARGEAAVPCEFDGGFSFNRDLEALLNRRSDWGASPVCTTAAVIFPIQQNARMLRRSARTLAIADAAGRLRGNLFRGQSTRRRIRLSHPDCFNFSASERELRTGIQLLRP